MGSFFVETYKFFGGHGGERTVGLRFFVETGGVSTFYTQDMDGGQNAENSVDRHKMLW